MTTSETDLWNLGGDKTPDPIALVRQEWSDFVDSLRPLAERLSGYVEDPHDPQLRYELYRNLISGMATGYLSHLYGDARQPDFWPLTTHPAFNCWLNNPDTLYYFTPVDDDGVYRISGYRGTVKTVDFQIGGGRFMLTAVPDEHNLGTTLANYDVDQHASVGEDGYFEVILSATCPDNWVGDWWELHQGATNIIARQISYDWVGEVDGRYGIERLDTPAAKPRPSAEELRTKILEIANWSEGTVRATGEYAKHIRSNWWNQIRPWDISTYLPILGQQYVYGAFRLEVDEALLVTFQVPEEVGYWSIGLGDHMGFMLDWAHRHTFINGHTTHVQPDRTCHVVISAEDPGITNWLDTMGYRTFEIQLRWNKCDRYPDDYKVTKIKVDQVKQFLENEPCVTPEEREATIRRRRHGCQMRKRA